MFAFYDLANAITRIGKCWVKNVYRSGFAEDQLAREYSARSTASSAEVKRRWSRACPISSGRRRAVNASRWSRRQRSMFSW
jgi:hypothetical protein